MGVRFPQGAPYVYLPKLARYPVLGTHIWRGFYPQELGEQGDRVPNPKFLLLRDSYPKAEDMYWDGSTIIKEQPPSWEEWHKKREGNPELSLVKDWRDALQQLIELLQESTAKV